MGGTSKSINNFEMHHTIAAEGHDRLGMHQSCTETQKKNSYLNAAPLVNIIVYQQLSRYML